MDKFERILRSKYKIIKTKGEYAPKYAKPWWNEKCSQLVAIRRREKNNFKRRPTQQNLISWRTAENNAKVQIKKSKEESWKQFASTLTHTSSNAKVWSMLRKMKGRQESKPIKLIKNNNIIVYPNEKVNEFAHYFEQLFNIRTPSIQRNKNIFLKYRKRYYPKGKKITTKHLQNMSWKTL